MRAVAFVHAYVGHGRNAGAETTLHGLLSALVRNGWDVDVLLSEPQPGVPTDYTIDGVAVHPLRGKRDPLEWFPKADLILCHLDTSERTVYIAESLQIPVVQVIHNDNTYTKGYLGLGTALAVYNTHWVADSVEGDRANPIIQVADKSGVTTKIRKAYDWPSVVVHPNVPVADYKVTSGPHDCVTLINLWDGDGFKCGKGPHVFYRLAREYPNTKFLGVRGGYGEQVIEDLPNVEVVDNTDDMTLVYKRTKILLMPSRYESFGRVCIEAAASGIPTLATPTPGLVEALGSGGLFARLDEPRRWDNLLGKLLDDKDFYNDASWYAKDRAEYWEKTSAQELDEFCLLSEAVVTEWRGLKDGVHND